MVAYEQYEYLLKCATEDHKVLALRAVFTEEKYTFLKVRVIIHFQSNRLQRSG